ncbi:MAG: DUF2171 domain-containing protein [Thermomicrobiales bacterium]
MAMTDRTQIQEHMPVVCSNNVQFGTVDRVEGNFIKLTKDDQGQHHWIPMDWVNKVDQHVHIDRPGQQAMQEWMSSPPAIAGMGDEATQPPPM